MGKHLTTLAAGLALALLCTPGAALAESPGLWSSTFQANTSECSPFLNDGHFCYTGGDGGGAVELGVKFTSSKNVDMVGVRAYRSDSASVTGSLWSTDGTRLASGEFDPYSGTHAWQDVRFASPVPIDAGAGKTYIASYYSPSADYAFEHYFFTNSAYPVGPLTATQSVAGNGNGVFCYDAAVCSFPTDTYQDTNYWVTPLWAYRFTGFYQPVDNIPVWNTAKAGSAIPVKFSLADDQGLDVIKSGFPTATEVTCPGASTTLDAIEETVAAASQSGVTYDSSTGQYTYVWKTGKASVNKCYRFELGLKDDSSHIFYVELLK